MSEKYSTVKICRLQIQDSLKNKKTLSVSSTDGYITYRMWGGWSSSGMGFSTSDMLLPMALHSDTNEQFIEKVKQSLKPRYTVVETILPIEEVIIPNISRFDDLQFAEKRPYYEINRDDYSSKSEYNKECLVRDVIQSLLDDVKNKDFTVFAELLHQLPIKTLKSSLPEKI